VPQVQRELQAPRALLGLPVLLVQMELQVPMGPRVPRVRLVQQGPRVLQVKQVPSVQRELQGLQVKSEQLAL
jgi:hypothetical protein